MKIFITGASGYIGGSVAAALIADGHEVVGLARTAERVGQIEQRGMQAVRGELDNTKVLQNAVAGADAIINTADAEHAESVNTMLRALAGTNKKFIHTSGTSIVADCVDGERAGDVFDESTTFNVLPLRAGRVAINDQVIAAAGSGVHAIVICPSLIYGTGHGIRTDSIQVPWLFDVARANGIACHVGSGKNIWSNVHIDDLVSLYQLALDDAPAGSFFYAENGENSMRDTASCIGESLGFGSNTKPLTVAEAVALWGEGGARYTMGSNSRVRAVAARNELGWNPTAPSLQAEIEAGYYANDSN